MLLKTEMARGMHEDNNEEFFASPTRASTMMIEDWGFSYAPSVADCIEAWTMTIRQARSHSGPDRGGDEVRDTGL